MSLLTSFNFKCFRHPQKKVEVICTEPFCSQYRFFCVQCFFEYSPHFISHKQTIHEINDVLEQHQNCSFKNSAVSELQQGLMKVKTQMKEYEQIIKSKHSTYIKAIESIEKSFQQAKNTMITELEEYLSNLVSKQQLHFQYLENKMKVHVRDASLSDWATVDRKNENDVTGYFENIIKSPLSNTKDFQSEVNFYVQSFRRNIQDLDNLSNSKMVNFFSEDMNNIFKNKFSELKQLLIMSAEELPLGNGSKMNFSKLNNSLLNNGSTSSEFKFKYFTTPSGSIDVPSLNLYNPYTTGSSSNGTNQYGNYYQQGNLKNSSNGIQGGVKNFYTSHTSEEQQNNDFELETNQISGSSCMAYSTILPKNIIEKNPLHAAGICSMIIFQESPLKKIIATGSLDNSIKFWQLESSSFDFIKTIKGHSSPVYSLQKIEKENNIFLASGSSDGEVKIWNPILQGKELLATFNDHQDSIISIKYCDDFLVTASLDKTVKVWNLDDLFCCQTLNQDQPVTGLCKYKDEKQKFLISACGDGFRIWIQKNPGDFKLKSYNNKAHKKGSNNIDIATSGTDGLIKLWNLDKGMCVHQLQGHTKNAYQLIFSPINNLLYSCSSDETIRVWDLEKQIQCYDNGNKYINDCPKLGEFIVFDEHNFVLTSSNDLNIIKIITMS